MLRYGNPQYCEEMYKPFAIHFRSNSAPILLSTILKVLGSHHTNNVFITETVHRSCLAFVGGAIEMSPTYKIIKPHLNFLLFNIILPTLSITTHEIEYIYIAILIYMYLYVIITIHIYNTFIIYKYIHLYIISTDYLKMILLNLYEK